MRNHITKKRDAHTLRATDAEVYYYLKRIGDGLYYDDMSDAIVVEDAAELRALRTRQHAIFGCIERKGTYWHTHSILGDGDVPFDASSDVVRNFEARYGPLQPLLALVEQRRVYMSLAQWRHYVDASCRMSNAQRRAERTVSWSKSPTKKMRASLHKHIRAEVFSRDIVP